MKFKFDRTNTPRRVRYIASRPCSVRCRPAPGRWGEIACSLLAGYGDVVRPFVAKDSTKVGIAGVLAVWCLIFLSHSCLDRCAEQSPWLDSVGEKAGNP